MVERKKQDPRYTAFVKAYFYDFAGGCAGNAVQAALKAGFAKTTACRKAYSWTTEDRQKATNKTIFDMVQTERQKVKEEFGITRERIIEELKKAAFFSPKEFFHTDGRLKQASELDDELASLAIFDVSTKTYEENARKIVEQTTRVKFADRKAALDSLCKITGLFIDRQEHSGPGGGPIEHRWTNFPKEPETIAEFERQCREADAARRLSNSK